MNQPYSTCFWGRHLYPYTLQATVWCWLDEAWWVNTDQETHPACESTMEKSKLNEQEQQQNCFTTGRRGRVAALATSRINRNGAEARKTQTLDCWLKNGKK